MEIHTFNSLRLPDKVVLLHKEGIYVGKQKSKGVTKIMFQLTGFYVEIVYHKYREQISSIVISKNVESLLPYLDQIDIKELAIS